MTFELQLLEKKTQSIEKFNEKINEIKESINIIAEDPNKIKKLMILGGVGLNIFAQSVEKVQRSVFVTAYMFNHVVCKCSHRTIEEEKLYGSYCDNCWNNMKKYMKCLLCVIPVEKERLYIDTTYKIPTCKSCFLSHNFNERVKLKLF